MGALGALFTTYAASNVGETVSRYKRNAILYSVAGLLLFAAFIYGMIALTIWLSEMYSPVTATAGIAFAFFVVAVLILLVMMGLKAKDRKLALERRRIAQNRASVALAASNAIFYRNPIIATGIAFGLSSLIGALAPRKK